MVSRRASRREVRGSSERAKDLPFTLSVVGMALSRASVVWVEEGACSAGSAWARSGAVVAATPAAPICERKERRLTVPVLGGCSSTLGGLCWLMETPQVRLVVRFL